MDLAPDFGEFIASLIAHGVEFVIVGAYALAFHGAPHKRAAARPKDLADIDALSAGDHE